MRTARVKRHRCLGEVSQDSPIVRNPDVLDVGISGLVGEPLSATGKSSKPRAIDPGAIFLPRRHARNNNRLVAIEESICPRNALQLSSD